MLSRRGHLVKPQVKALIQQNERSSVATCLHPGGLPLTTFLAHQPYHTYVSRKPVTLSSHPYQHLNGHFSPCKHRLIRSFLPPSNMSTILQTRSHTGHSHHHHHHDNAYLVSANKNDAGVKITRIGLYVNLAMAVGKGIGGWAFHSQALIADAFHSLTDLVSDFMTLATISWSLKPPTERFPYGYGKIESLGALGVSGILLLGGMGMAMNSLDVLYLQFFLNHAHDLAGHDGHVHGLFGFGHSHSHSTNLPNLNAAWLAAGSIGVKEWLYRASKWQSNSALILLTNVQL